MDLLCPCTNVVLTVYAHVRTEPQCDIGHTRGKKKHGAWESQAACVLHKIATAAALRLGQDRAQVFQTLLQELGVLGRSFRARAVLRRRLAMTDS